MHGASFGSRRPQPSATPSNDGPRTHPTWRGKVGAFAPTQRKQGSGRPRSTRSPGVEQSLVQQHYDRSLVQMATGAGKTYTAVTLSYRLLKHGGFNRILFLVDRNNLAKQTMG